MSGLLRNTAKIIGILICVCVIAAFSREVHSRIEIPEISFSKPGTLDIRQECGYIPIRAKNEIILRKIRRDFGECVQDIHLEKLRED